MKAKDIALLCTAAAGAGAAAGIAATSSKPIKEKPPAPRSKKQPAEKTSNLKPVKAEASEICFDTEHSPAGQHLKAVYSHSSAGIIVMFGEEGRHTVFKLDTGRNITPLRCPAGVSGAAAGDGCTMFITPRGGVFVYDDREKEPVLCALTAPEYGAYYDGKFYVFSDSLLYICTPDGEIEKTVSLGAMIDISSGDICDAEDSDSSFTAARVCVKKLCPMGSYGLFAVIADDGNSYLMHRDEDDFVCFEKTYENITDVCVFGSFAYYLYKGQKGYGIIKTEIKKRSCETAGKYQLCGEDRTPVKLFSVSCGIGVLYTDGSVKLLLPEISSERAREKARRGLSAMNAVFADISAEDIFELSDSCGYVRDGKLFIIE